MIDSQSAYMMYGHFLFFWKLMNLTVDPGLGITILATSWSLQYVTEFTHHLRPIYEWDYPYGNMLATRHRRRLHMRSTHPGVATGRLEQTSPTRKRSPGHPPATFPLFVVLSYTTLRVERSYCSAQSRSLVLSDQNNC